MYDIVKLYIIYFVTQKHVSKNETTYKVMLKINIFSEKIFQSLKHEIRIHLYIHKSKKNQT